MRAVLILVLALGGPAALYFLWAWASAIKRERKLKGTLPPWQDLPWTNLLIAGLLLAIAGVLSLYFIDDRKGGLLGSCFPSPGGGRWRAAPEGGCSYRFDIGSIDRIPANIPLPPFGHLPPPGEG